MTLQFLYKSLSRAKVLRWFAEEALSASQRKQLEEYCGEPYISAAHNVPNYFEQFLFTAFSSKEFLRMCDDCARQLL